MKSVDERIKHNLTSLENRTKNVKNQLAHILDNLSRMFNDKSFVILQTAFTQNLEKWNVTEQKWYLLSINLIYNKKF